MTNGCDHASCKVVVRCAPPRSADVTLRDAQAPVGGVNLSPGHKGRQTSCTAN